MHPPATPPAFQQANPMDHPSPTPADGSSAPPKPPATAASHGPVEAWHLLRITCREWWDDDPFRLAASLAFYTIFSIAPLLLIAVLAASFFFTQEVAARRIEDEMQNLIGNQGAQAVRQIIEASKGLGSSNWAIVVGIGTIIIGSTAVFGELQAALNKLWDVETKVRRGLVLRLIADRARSFALALGVGFLLLVSLVFSAVLNAVQAYLTGRLPGVPALWQAMNFISSLVIAALLFAMIYRFLPDVRLRWKDVGIGAAVTAILFSVGKSLIGLYLGRAAVAGVYGAAGSFVVLLFWIYYSSLIVFFGAEFTQVYARRHGSGIEPEEYAKRTGRKPDRV